MARNYLTQNPSLTIDETVDSLSPDKVLIVTDLNVEREVLSKLSESLTLKSSPRLVIPAGEKHKNLDTVIEVWKKLEDIGATRKSVVINIGGGVVTDLGGFAAATFKRGIRTINFPTTLLGAVDAATGGKTGIDFMGLKNEIGAFHMPQNVILSSMPFATLPESELLSGYAEMVKTAIISDRDFYISLLDFENVADREPELGKAVEKCVSIKDDVVASDPQEKGLRKILNFGHTAGHAFESICIENGREITHGKAVAHGMLVALILSHLVLGFDSKEVAVYTGFLRCRYGSSPVKCEEMPQVLQKMNSDKKNPIYGQPSFTLLKDIGVPVTDCLPTQQEIMEALEIYSSSI